MQRPLTLILRSGQEVDKDNKETGEIPVLSPQLCVSPMKSAGRISNVGDGHPPGSVHGCLSEDCQGERPGRRKSAG